MASIAAGMRITELPRPGAATSAQPPDEFVWDARSHSMIQDTLDFAMKVTSVREMPPGAEEPVEQIMSTEWEPFEMHGEWNDKWAGSGFAWDTYVAFAKFVGRTTLARVELNRHRFVGIFTGLKIRYRTDNEIGYTVTFSTHRNDTIGTAGYASNGVKKVTPPDETLSEQDDYLSSIHGPRDDLKSAPVDHQQLLDFDEATKTLQEEIDRSKSAASAVALDQNSSDLLRSLDFAEQTQRRFLALAVSFDRVVVAAQSVADFAGGTYVGDLTLYDNVGANLTAEIWARDTFENSVRLMTSAQLGADSARTRATQRPRTLYTTKSGDTFERISQKFYGTPNNAIAIFEANPQLDSMILQPDQVVIVPERVQ